MNKQIEEMDASIRDVVKSHFVQVPQYSRYGGYEGAKEILTRQIATALYNAGYRKKEDVAREIFAEIDNILWKYKRSGMSINVSHIHCEIVKLKKKYEVQEDASDD